MLGSALILAAVKPGGEASADAAGEALSVQGPYLGLAAALLALAVLIALARLPAITGDEPVAADLQAGATARSSVWQYRHLVLGALCIFVYVGAEVSIGSFLVIFMHRPDVAGLPQEVAGNYVSLYWGGAMVGRFIGAAVLARVRPGKVLAFNAMIAAVLLVIAMVVAGRTAMWALLLIGLFNSIMFPTIFTLAIAGLGRFTGAGSGIVCMAIVGGAIVPVLQGFIADHDLLLYSLIVPAVCYLYIAWYGLSGHRPRP